MSEKRNATVGRIVNYHVSENDSPELKNNFVVGEVLPAIIVRVWTGETVNLKVFTDGPVDVWKTSVVNGEAEGNWSWPVIGTPQAAIQDNTNPNNPPPPRPQPQP